MCCFFNDTATTEIYTYLHTLSLHDALPISETLAMIDTGARRYGVALTVLRPDPGDVAEHVARHGEFAFYESLELRKACCAIRKVAHLRMALPGRSAGLTGQRLTPSQTRDRRDPGELDDVVGLFHYNPLLESTAETVWSVLHALDFPY